MSVFKGNRHNEVWMDPDKTVAKGTCEDNPHAFDVDDPNRPPRIQPVAQHWSENPFEQDKIRNEPLTIIPEPGLIIFPNTVSYSQKPRESLLMMKPNWKSKGFDVVDITGNSPPVPAFTIENPSPKLKATSSKRVFSNANNGAKLCVFEKATAKVHSTYRAINPDTKAPLVEIKVKKNDKEITATMTILVADKPPTTDGDAIHFSNEIDDGTSKRKSVSGNDAPTLEWKGHATELRGMIEYQGNLVATIEKKFLITSTEYHLRITQGLDPFLVCVMAAAIEDKRRSGEGMLAFGLSMGASG